ncbi:hypothetical protein [Geothrix fuzhouensis]|uniref:hypothetical protein n=1 Tax=Geothrix fuzhouensis TaxID=2966451 RepID=UPI002149895F|nr:hypothetical protein [Geothrix fuzhouensis]
MALELIEKLNGIVVSDADRLDPVRVIFHDIAPGQGYLIVTCYNRAWTTYWGGMSGKTVREFVSGCDADYVARNLTWNIKATKAEMAYVMRVARVVIDACRAA